MKTILFTGLDEPYEALAAITVPCMGDYARNHGVDFCVWEDPPDGLNIYWTGVARALELLRDGYERVMYLDVDQLITNPDISPLSHPPFGFWCSSDWGEDATAPWHFSACGWIAHGDCKPMFEAVLDMEPAWRDKPFQEQGPWQEWMRERTEGLKMYPNDIKQPGLINVAPRRIFNAVPDDVCPGKVPEPWQPGDFAAHLTMLPMEERIALARKIIAASST